MIVENIVNRPEDEANEDEKKRENDRHEGAQPVEKRYRRIITLAHLTMMIRDGQIYQYCSFFNIVQKGGGVKKTL